MSEPVEQAALRRATTGRFDVLNDVVDALEKMTATDSAQSLAIKACMERIDRLHDELAEKGDAILALSNRIEALTRTVIRHPGMEVTEPLVMWTEP